MMTRLILPVAIVALLGFASSPVRATAEHTYAKNEYAIIDSGLAPNKRLSVAAHGDGEIGFHIWLMAEPRHRKLAALDGIGNNILDTAPQAYYAFWSPDSRHVAVSFRSNRHIVQLNLYGIEGSRAKLVEGPSLFREVTSRDLDRDDDLRVSISQIEWRGPDRFVLKERRTFVTTESSFAGQFGSYGKVSEKREDGSFVVEFSAEADCRLLPGNRYRVVDLRTGKFGE